MRLEKMVMNDPKYGINDDRDPAHPPGNQRIDRVK